MAAHSYLYCILGCILSSYMTVLCRSQDVFFGVKGNGDTDQALSFSEQNTIITCNITCVGNASIEIRELISEHDPRPFNNLTQKTQHGHFLDYNVTEVKMWSKYSCSVNYDDPTNGSEISKEVFWSPHIIDEEDSVYCRRNGSVSQPYQIGDVLLLECFCNLTLATSCEWLSVKNESQTMTASDFMTIHGNITAVYSSIVGPVTVADETVTYVCRTSVDQRSTSTKGLSCAIQPRSHSAMDNVYNHILYSNCESSNDVTTIGSPHQPSNGISANRDDKPTLETKFIILIGLSIVIVVSIFICVVVSVIFMNRNRTNAIKKRGGTDIDEYPTIGNGNQGDTSLPAVPIDKYPSSSFTSGNKVSSSLQDSNEYSNVCFSDDDEDAYSMINKYNPSRRGCGKPHSYDSSAVDEAANLDFSDLYAKVQK